jgi:hypothetical protein
MHDNDTSVREQAKEKTITGRCVYVRDDQPFGGHTALAELASSAPDPLVRAVVGRRPPRLRCDRIKPTVRTSLGKATSTDRALRACVSPGPVRGGMNGCHRPNKSTRRKKHH